MHIWAVVAIPLVWVVDSLRALVVIVQEREGSLRERGLDQVVSGTTEVSLLNPVDRVLDASLLTLDDHERGLEPGAIDLGLLQHRHQLLHAFFTGGRLLNYGWLAR